MGRADEATIFTMNTITTEQLTALRELLAAVVDAVKVAGSNGAPGGVLYSALMAHGCTLAQFEGVMGALVRTGKLERRGELYFAP